MGPVSLIAIESRDNHAAIEVERDKGFVPEPFEGEALGGDPRGVLEASGHIGFPDGRFWTIIGEGVVTHVPFPDPYHPVLLSRPGEDYGETVVRYLEEEIFGRTVPADEVAGILVEPIQGEGGVFPVSELRKIRIESLGAYLPEQVLTMEQGPGPGEWGFKALKQIVKLRQRLGQREEMLAAYRRSRFKWRPTVVARVSASCVNVDRILPRNPER